MYNQFVESPFNAVQAFAKTATNKSALLTELIKLRMLVKAVSVALPEMRQNIIKELSKIEPEGAAKTHIYQFDASKIVHSRQEIGELLHNLVTVLLQQPETDVPVLIQCIKVCCHAFFLTI